MMQQARSYLKPDEDHSVNIEGGQLTTDVRTRLSQEQVEKQIYLFDSRMPQLLDHIEPIEHGYKLVWNIHDATRAEIIAPAIRDLAQRIARL